MREPLKVAWLQLLDSKLTSVPFLPNRLTLEYLEADFYAGALHKYNAAAFKAAGCRSHVFTYNIWRRTTT